MNATETIFALALASNFNPKPHFQQALRQIQALGHVEFSKIYVIPCRDGIGADFHVDVFQCVKAIGIAEINVFQREMAAQGLRFFAGQHCGATQALFQIYFCTTAVMSCSAGAIFLAKSAGSEWRARM